MKDDNSVWVDVDMAHANGIHPYEGQEEDVEYPVVEIGGSMAPNTQ